VSKMSPEDLAAIVSAMRRDALGVEDGQLSQERAKAMDHYHGRPYGNEVEGRSAVVSKDLAEAVDWALPSIMRVFTQSGSIAQSDNSCGRLSTMRFAPNKKHPKAPISRGGCSRAIS